jgi:hypothetical protein
MKGHGKRRDEKGNLYVGSEMNNKNDKNSPHYIVYTV